jgi:hypothetical protein
MIALSGQRFVGASQAGETRGERSERVNHAIKHNATRLAAPEPSVRAGTRGGALLEHGDRQDGTNHNDTE